MHSKYLTYSLLIGCAMLLSAGCQPAKVASPLDSKFLGSKPEEQMEFWHKLTGQRVTTNDEAFHGLLLYLDGFDAAGSFEARVVTLKSKKLLPESFSGNSDDAITRGTLAIVIAKALEVKGGITMHVFPNSQRYATRELVSMDILPPSSPNQTFSGTEFVGVIGKIEDYQRGSSSAKSPSN